MSNNGTQGSRSSLKRDIIPSTHPTVPHQQVAKLDEGHLPKSQKESSAPPSMQEVLSASLCLYGEMKKSYPHQMGSTLDYDTFEYVPFEAKNFPPLMDWISLYFARGKDDVVASAMSRHSHDATLTIHLALSRDRVVAEDKAICKDFMSLLKDILGGNTAIHPHANRRDYDLVLSTLIKTCWSKIASRIQKLQGLVRSTPQGSEIASGMLDGMLTSWLQQHPDISASSVRESTMKCLKAVISVNSQVSTAEDRMDCMKRVINACQAIAKLGYLEVANSCEEDDWTKSADENHLLRLELSYAIHRILDYHHGTEIFLSWGVPSLFRPVIAGDHVEDIAAKLKFEWVKASEILQMGESHPTWSMNSDDWFVNNVHSKLNRYYVAKNKPTERDAALRAAAKNLWNSGNPVATKVHVEVQMVNYLQRKKITALHYAIGVSAPLCITCETYIQGFRNAVDHSEQWAVRSASGKFVKDWLCPPIRSTHVVGKLEWDRTAALVAVNGVGGEIYSFISGILEKVAAEE